MAEKTEKIDLARLEKFKEIKFEVYGVPSIPSPNCKNIDDGVPFLEKDELCLGSLKLVIIGVNKNNKNILKN